MDGERILAVGFVSFALSAFGVLATPIAHACLPAPVEVQLKQSVRVVLKSPEAPLIFVGSKTLPELLNVSTLSGTAVSRSLFSVEAVSQKLTLTLDWSKLPKNLVAPFELRLLLKDGTQRFTIQVVYPEPTDSLTRGGCGGATITPIRRD